MMSDKQKRTLILVLVIILACSIVFLGYSFSNNVSNNSKDGFITFANIEDMDNINNLKNINSSNNLNSTKDIENIVDYSLSSEPIPDAKIDTSNVSSQLLGQNNLGSVELLGPFGNPNSNIKIAYSIGMHPWESKVHKALFDTVLAKNSSLNYCYYIYKINVSNYNTDDEGRLDGQLLAQEFVAPHIINGNYSLFVDVHSNKGTVAGTYEKTNFVFAVGQDEKSEVFVNKILDKISELDYYFPQDQSSPPYITLPTEEAGIPTVNYETFSYESPETTYDLVYKLVNTIDSLEF